MAEPTLLGFLFVGYSVGATLLWDNFVDAPPLLDFAGLYTRHVAVPEHPVLVDLPMMVDIPMIPTPSQPSPLPATPTTAVDAASSALPCLSILFFFGIFMFLWSILVLVARVDKNIGRDPIARYKKLADTLAPFVPSLVLQYIINLWAQLCRLCRLALGLVLSLFWSILVLDVFRFLVVCNIIGGIAIDLLCLLISALRFVSGTFARNTVPSPHSAQPDVVFDVKPCTVLRCVPLHVYRSLPLAPRARALIAPKDGHHHHHGRSRKSRPSPVSPTTTAGIDCRTPSPLRLRGPACTIAPLQHNTQLQPP